MNPAHLPYPTRTLWQLLGPSIVFVALSLSGGEILLWPDLVGKYGLFILWPIPLILLLQVSVNLEIERYTVVTGQNTLVGLIGLQKGLRYLCVLAIVLSLVWPAWASPSGNMIAHLLGIGGQGAWVAFGILFGLLFIWNSKKSYNILENLAKVGLVVVLFIAVMTIWQAFGLDVDTLPKEQWSFWPASNDKFLFLSALAYGGVTGVLNLVQSDWVAQKKYAVAGVENPHLIDWEHQNTHMAWKKWRRLVRAEHSILYYFGNLVGICLVSLVAFLTLGGVHKSGFSILVYQTNILNERTQWLGLAWGLGVAILFAMAQMSILDAAGRLLKRCITTKLESGRLSQLVGVAGLVILVATAIIPGFNQPAILLQISASLSAVVMAIYPPFLLFINSKLPQVTRPNIFSKVLVISCSLFYGIMTIWALLA